MIGMYWDVFGCFLAPLPISNRKAVNAAPSRRRPEMHRLTAVNASGRSLSLLCGTKVRIARVPLK